MRGRIVRELEVCPFSGVNDVVEVATIGGFYGADFVEVPDGFGAISLLDDFGGCSHHEWMEGNDWSVKNEDSSPEYMA